jgi:uncharacterized protein (DUF302 family)
VSDNGLITIASAYSVKDTIDRVETDIKLKGLTVFARVDHAAGAMEVGLSLAPTLLLIFGNARGGTPLMQAKQQVGIDLPLKMLAWQDGSGATWLTYNDPHWIAERPTRPSARTRPVAVVIGREKFPLVSIVVKPTPAGSSEYPAHAVTLSISVSAQPP